MPTITLLVGLPASGKSTWREKHYNQKHYNNVDNCYVLSTDDMIEAYAFQVEKTYDEVFSLVINEMTSKFFILLKQYLNKGYDIIIDRTNLSVKSRKKILDMVPKNYRKEAVVIQCDEKTLNERLNFRPGKTIPKHVVESMKASYQEPTFSEGFDCIYNYNTGV